MANHTSKELIDRWLSTPEGWFEKGADLYEHAVLIRDREMPEKDVIRVGHSAGIQVGSDANRFAPRRDVGAAMLFGMAVECWLKGIRILQMTTSSRDLSQETYDYLNTTLDGLNVTGEDFMAALSLVLNDPETIARFQTLEDKRDSEGSLAVQELRTNHNRHELLELAKAVDLPHNDELSGFLDLLTAANQLGRYPASYKPNRNVQLKDGEIVDPEKWEALKSAIFELYESLR